MICRICGNSAGNQTYSVKEMYFGLREEFIYLECSKCGCLQIGEIPKDMSKYYPQSYHSFNNYPPDMFKNFISNYLKRLRDRHAIFGRGFIGKYLYENFHKCDLQFLSKVELNVRSKILDVGCGRGFTLYALKNAGFKNLLGVDPFIEDDIRYRNGPTVLKGTIYSVTDKCDVVLLLHTYEHVPDPVETLMQVSKILKGDGVCVVSIPTASSFAWRHYRNNWVHLDAPRHLFIYSASAMEYLCGTAGLFISDVVYDSTGFQFWGSEQYLRDIPFDSERSYAKNPSKSIFSKKQIEEYENRSKELNDACQGDTAVFYLKKKQ